jgi:hypothetical protein
MLDKLIMKTTKGSLGFVLWELEAETISHNKMKP